VSDPQEWVWIARWGDFQHYRPERDSGPAWIKDYTKQLRDDRYLGLTDRQRALLGDIRRIFAVAFPWLRRDVAVIARHRHQQTFRTDLDALRDAGFIEFHSRASLEKTLEAFLLARARGKKKRKTALEEEPPYPLGKGDDLDPQTARSVGANPRALDQRAKRQRALSAFVTAFINDYTEEAMVEELTQRGCRLDEALDLLAAERATHQSEVG